MTRVVRTILARRALAEANPFLGFGAFMAAVTLAAWLPLAALAQASPVPASATSPSPAATESPNGLIGASPPPVADAAITTRAKDWLHRVQTGDVDRAQLNGQMNTILSDEAIKGAATQFGPLGSPTNFTLVDMRTVAGSNAYLYRATFATTSLFWLFSVDRSGKIDGLRFLPAH